MAVYKNREVDVAFSLPQAQGMVEVTHKGTLDKEHAKLAEVRFTKEEMDKLEKQHKTQMTEHNTISDKELQDLRDSQDPEKIKKAEKDQVAKDHKANAEKPVSK